jgi:hypothetical protein
MNSNTRYYTRRELPKLFQERLGVPIAFATIVKRATEGRGPKPAAIIGQRHLYTEDDALAWAKSMIQPVGATA